MVIPKFWTQTINGSIFTWSIKLLACGCSSSISSQKALLPTVERHWLWGLVYSFKVAKWAPIGLEFLWELRNSTKLGILCLGRRQGRSLFRILVSLFLTKRICLCRCGHCVRCHGPQSGERRDIDSRCGLTFLLRYLSSLPLFVSLFVNDTDTLGHLSSYRLKKFKYRICGKMSHILKLYNLSYFFYGNAIVS